MFVKPSFFARYENKKAPFGYDGLGEFVYNRTYKRGNETFADTVRRVVDGTYQMQKNHIERENLGWDEEKGIKSAETMFDLMFNMKFLPPGRGLWTMGTDITNKKGIYTALNNCAFISTKNIAAEKSKPFRFLMDVSMLGVGCGFDTKGEGKIGIKSPIKIAGSNAGGEIANYVKMMRDHIAEIAVLAKTEQNEYMRDQYAANIALFENEIAAISREQLYETKVIPDTREGWVESLGHLLDSYFNGSLQVMFDYSQIRPRGILLKTFGGVSSGPIPLVELHIMIKNILNANVGKSISTQTIVDIMNLIGKCVVAGNVRRTSELALGPTTEEFLNLKNYAVNPERATYGWCSNNSIYGEVGMDYSKIADLIKINGEPGVFWLDNARRFSRMCDAADGKDHRVEGANPCVEQSLESYEMCTLVEVFIAKHATFEEFAQTLKYAFLYAKTVTLGESHWQETNRVMRRNRRIGLSLTGITQFVSKFGLETLRQWCDAGYKVVKRWDEIYSDWFAIPKSIKLTTIKPSGTVSLLAGSTPGCHFPIAEFYIRRVRISNDSELIPELKRAGYHIEPAADNGTTTSVVSFIVANAGERIARNVSMWEKLEIAATLQEYWSDNQVSVTIDFDAATEGEQIKYALPFFERRLKAVSFLPKWPNSTPYKQMPYEEISKEEYDRLIVGKSALNFAKIDRADNVEIDTHCDGEFCTVPSVKKQKGE